MPPITTVATEPLKTGLTPDKWARRPADAHSQATATAPRPSTWTTYDSSSSQNQVETDESTRLSVSARASVRCRRRPRGVHHIALATPNFDDVVAEQIQRGNTLPLSGSFSGVNIAYLPTDRDLGVILETFSGLPGADQGPDATWIVEGERRASRLR